MAGPLDIIYFASVDWNYTWQRPQQLASRLSRFGRLLYVNPLGLRPPRANDLSRIVSKLGRFGKPVTSETFPSLTVFDSAIYFPFPNLRRFSEWNGSILRRRVYKWIKTHGIASPIVWVGTPSFAALQAIHRLDRRMLIYDCMDNLPLFHKDPFHIIEAEERLSSQADLVLTTAHELYERLLPNNPNTFLVPNADEWEHFALAMDRPGDRPPDLVGLSKPFIGYFGEIAEWFDLDLVTTVATEHPEWTIVLIGPEHHRYASKLRQIPNIHLLGRKAYSELPLYLREFDVCIVPFKINALTSSVNPIKLYEYLAAGKPVVSTPLKEILPFQDVIRVADRANFASAIESSLQDFDSHEIIERRQKVARENTWDQRVEKIVGLITARLAAT